MLNDFHSQSEYIATFTEWPLSFFTSVSGGEYNREITQRHPGGLSGAPRNIHGPFTISQVVVEKPYELAVDAPLLAWMRAATYGVLLRGTLVKTPVDAAGIPRGLGVVTYVRCSLVNFVLADVDKESAEAAMIRITVQPEDII